MKLFVRTLGCAMNVKDSEHFISQLKDDYELCDSPNDADLVLINTCSVRAERSVACVAARPLTLERL